jgi:signal transduction histidine kinase/ligand-binding sensor domain-containing protein
MKTDKAIFECVFKFRISNFRFLRVPSYRFAAKILCICSLLSSISSAQEASRATDAAPISAQNFHQWGAVTLFNGLPSDNARAIAQTPDGVLWFGTDNGLTRFDGRRVQTVAPENIESSKIFALEIDGDGRLWVGTERGAYFLQNDIFKKIEETADFAITSILPRENVYLSTADGVVFRLTANNENSFSVEKIPAEPLVGSDGKLLKITGLIEKDGTLVAATRSRSILVLENTEFFETFSRPRPFFVNALAQDESGGAAWLGADAKSGESGFFSLRDIARPEKIGSDLGNVLAIEADAGGVWVGTQAKGLFYFRGAQQMKNFTFENTAGGLRSNTIYALFVDREGVLWIGTNRGVSRFDASSPFTRILSAENSNGNFVRALYRTKDRRIFAGTNRGLFEFDGANWLEIPNFAARAVYTISENSLNQTLLAAPTGIFSLDGKQILAGDARSTVEFQGKTYAAVFGRGILQIDGANQTQIFAVDAPTALYADGEKLWIGTAKGEVFTFDGKQMRQEKALEALRETALRKIAKDAEGSLWFGGANGLFRFKNGELQNVVAGREVRDFLTDGAEIWAATLNGGLVHVKADENFGWIAADINVEQGLPSEQIFALLRQENQLLIGTNRGGVAYAPSAIPPQIIAARILSQRLHNAEEAARAIKLEYPQNSILVEVAGLSSRTFPEQFQYAFFLKNSKGETLEKKLSSDSQFAPANLDAGEYRIEARAFNKDLLASEPLIIRFSIDREPFPWTTTALGVLLAIALIALIWAIVERKRISNRNRELAAARFDLANEAERERKRIARDLHDQTLADLRNLMLKTDKLPADNSDFRAEIESVSTEIRRICEDLSPSVLENVGLTAALEFLLSHTIENYKFSAAENLEESLNFSSNAQMQIYRIAQEILSNIKRHSDADAVEMKIEISAENEFILSISDNGTPLAPAADTARGRGISNVKSRAALIKAEVFWRTNENGNTLFELRK